MALHRSNFPSPLVGEGQGGGDPFRKGDVIADTEITDGFFRARHMEDVMAHGYFFTLYPVLKIHHTVVMHMARKTVIMARLTSTLTSDIS